VAVLAVMAVATTHGGQRLGRLLALCRRQHFGQIGHRARHHLRRFVHLRVAGGTLLLDLAAVYRVGRQQRQHLLTVVGMTGVQFLHFLAGRLDDLAGARFLFLAGADLREYALDHVLHALTHRFGPVVALTVLDRVGTALGARMGLCRQIDGNQSGQCTGGGKTGKPAAADR